MNDERILAYSEQEHSIPAKDLIEDSDMTEGEFRRAQADVDLEDADFSPRVIVVDESNKPTRNSDMFLLDEDND